MSSMVLNDLNSSITALSKDIELNYLDLLTYRPISNEIAQRYNIHHESPQSILLVNGKAVFHCSHHEARAIDILTGLEKAR